jgi:RNA polymerase sigma-70 factor (ECF subfamily)
VAEPADSGSRSAVSRYARAFEAADVPALVRMLTDDVILEMPPVPLWYRGRSDYGRFMERVFRTRGTGWAARELSANGQPALAAYAPDPAGGRRLHTLQVFTVVGGLVARTVVFADPAVFAAFDLAERIPDDGSDPAR